ncbi:fatty-acid-binding protein 3, chloroplastic [Phragmites australis]|uniref:fatty-acid-binding protein 3, chloroplastic n=1 Tax=Phragmites australis TaxID=29695 RepID=UPI002D79739B|nr:fatty-acid-binding protein 3, chloroplastic [Phragmites australis]
MSLASVVLSARASTTFARSSASFRCRTRMRLLLHGGAPEGSTWGSDWPAVRREAAPGRCRSRLRLARGAVGDPFVTESTTNMKFPRELTVPGYMDPLVILGTGYRDKFFLKVYAAALYVDYSHGIDAVQWKEKTGIESFDASSVFDSIFKAPVVKSLSIILVRDVDGKTFVNALNDVIARQIKKPTAEEESALSTFQNTFLGRNLKQGTSIYLTWLEPSRMLISISENQDPCQVDAEIKSATVNYALYDGFFGNSPVSPSLRSSCAQLLEALLMK